MFMLLSLNINIFWSWILVLNISDFILIILNDADKLCTTLAELQHCLLSSDPCLGHCIGKVNWDTYTCSNTTYKLRLQSYPLTLQSLGIVSSSHTRLYPILLHLNQILTNWISVG